MISILAIIISSIVIICCVGNIVATECAARQSLRALGTYTIKIKNDPDFTMKQFGIDIREYENPNAALEWQDRYWSTELIVFDRNFVSVSLSQTDTRGIESFTYFYTAKFSISDNDFRSFYAS